MSIYKLKPAFQWLLRPRVKRLAQGGVTPNQITCFALAGSAAVGVVLCLFPWRGLFILLPVWFFLRMALNAMDGMMAREYGQQTLFGCYLNELADIVSDAFLYLPFAQLPEFWPPFVLLFIFLAALAETAGILGVLAGASRRYDGPLGKSDRAALLGLLALVLVFVPRSGLYALVFPVLDTLLCLTICNRIRHGMKEAAAKRNP